MPVPELLAISNAAMPGVLVLGKRKGTNTRGLRLNGMLATLSPTVGKPLTQAAGIRVEGGEVAKKPLDRALQLLELEWQTLVGEGAQTADDDAPEDAAGALLEEAWLAGDPADATSMLRL
eukprot:4761503-Pleurochrysis_carterae.AAC.1